MAKKNNAQAQAQASAKVEAPATTPAEVSAKVETPAVNTDEKMTSPYAANAMRAPIIQKSLSGKRGAITLAQVEECGGTESTLQQWEYQVGKLYDCAIEFAQKYDDETRTALWEQWRAVLKCGEKDALHPNLFVRERDVENLRVLAAESDELHIEDIGFVATVKGKRAFRSKIEIRLACRIAGNETLNDDDREVMVEMKRAERMITSANRVLDGYTQGQINVPGIEAQIIAAEKELKDAEEALKKAGVAEPARYTKAIVGKITNLKNSKTSAKSRLAKGTQAKAKLQEKYDTVIARLDSIEGKA